MCVLSRMEVSTLSTNKTPGNTLLTHTQDKILYWRTGVRLLHDELRKRKEVLDHT